MRTPYKTKLKNLNPYSWSLLLTYFLAVLAMQYGTMHFSMEGVWQTLPLIVFALVCLQKYAVLLGQTNRDCNKSIRFKQDMLILNFAFLLSCLWSLVFSFRNSDVKAWWPVIMAFTMFYGLWYSLGYSLLAFAMKSHRRYTVVIACLLAMMIAFGPFLPRYVFGRVELLYAVTLTLLVMHGLAVFVCAFTTNRAIEPN